MDQVSSCLVEKDDSKRRRLKQQQQQQQKSAPKITGNSWSAAGSFNSDCYAGSKRSSLVAACYSTKATDSSSSNSSIRSSSGPKTAIEETDNTISPIEGRNIKPENSSSMSLSNNSLNNNNKSSYSKIFLQYLPQTLNLNYLSNSSKSQKRGLSSKQVASEEVGKIREQLAEDSGNSRSISQKSKSSSTSKSIVNAFSKLRVQQQQQKKSFEQKVLNKEEGESLFSNSITSDIRGVDRKEEVDKLTSGSFHKHLRSNKDLEPAKEVCSKIKRRGFLYLKKGNFTSKTANSSSLIQSQEGACSSYDVQGGASVKVNSTSGQLIVNQTELEQQSPKLFNSTRKRRDLNNNSISNLISSSCNQKQDAEHNKCLLDNDDEEDEEGEKDLLINQHINTLYNNQKGSSNKMSVKQLNNNNNNNNINKYTKKKAITQKSVDSRALIMTSMNSLILFMCFGLFITIGISRLAFGQQQQPFSRSQPGSSSQLSSSNQNNGPNQSPSGSGRPAPQPAAGSLVANINCNKIKGHVTLTPNIQGGTTVSTQISAGPPGEVYQWSVHQFPVKPGAAMCSCSPMILGTKLIDLSEMHGNLPSDQEFNVQSQLNLFGSESPVGHSLLLRGMKTGMVACATFLPTSRKSNYRAKFHTPISGSVTIFQTAFGTSFISHLMYSNGTRRHSVHRFDLVKSEDDMVTTSLLSGVPVGGSLSVAGSSRAENLMLEQREHEHELTQCKRYVNGEPLFRNMSYQLAVSTENFGMRGRTAMVLPQIPFETFASVFVIVYSESDPSEPIACAPLKFVKPKTAAAKFQSVSVQGSVVFSQDSPYDLTVARINLQLPNSDGHSYGIDELPMIIRRKSDTRVCPNIREIIYNPHHVEPSSVPPEGEATSDQYAVGDLSGKYGSLTGKSSEKIQVNDFNLPLYGPISIVGRAMTIYSAEGVAIACSNVELTTPMTTAFATFDYGIQGQFIFRQPVNDCNGDTYVYIEVSKPVVGSTSSLAAAASSSNINNQQQDPSQRSLDHNWHIHVNPVDSGLDHLSTTDCAPAGNHFNPYNTSTSSIYSRDCTPFNVLRCELGDMSAKMFTIEIPPYRVKGGQEPDIGKFFGTDIDLPLCGPVSVVNRSVVVHTQDFGHQRLACSTVIEFKPRVS